MEREKKGEGGGEKGRGEGGGVEGEGRRGRGEEVGNGLGYERDEKRGERVPDWTVCWEEGHCQWLPQ